MDLCPNCENELEFNYYDIDESESVINVTLECKKCGTMVNAKGMLVDIEY